MVAARAADGSEGGEREEEEEEEEDTSSARTRNARAPRVDSRDKESERRDDVREDKYEREHVARLGAPDSSSVAAAAAETGVRASAADDSDSDSALRRSCDSLPRSEATRVDNSSCRARRGRRCESAHGGQ